MKHTRYVFILTLRYIRSDRGLYRDIRSLPGFQFFVTERVKEDMQVYGVLSHVCTRQKLDELLNSKTEAINCMLVSS